MSLYQLLKFNFAVAHGFGALIFAFLSFLKCCRFEGGKMLLKQVRVCFLLRSFPEQLSFERVVVIE